jgi:hypothetical protein
LNIGEKVDWAYLRELLAPLKDYPGVMWVRPKRINKSLAVPPDLVEGLS